MNEFGIQGEKTKEMIHLENEFIRISVKPSGAELCSIFHKEHRLEYLWQAGNAWPKHSPVLFPIVGQLKNNRYRYNGNEYTLSRHGFARERMFRPFEKGPGRLLFRLNDAEDTRKVYPFSFCFEIDYHLIKNCLHVTYIIQNKGDETMYFSVGAHPAFRVPLDLRDQYEDYTLHFDQAETSARWPLRDGLIDTTSTPFFTGKDLRISKALFNQDALVFKQLLSDYIELRSDKHAHGLKFGIYRCPYLGLWAAKNADFLCIEPWHGIADSVNASGQLEEKEGIRALAAGEFFNTSWSVEVF